jgi:beta-phosphoglucomutase-like phosphatase (HAD superfamily)
LRELLDGLDAAAIPFAIGSSTSRKNIETALGLCGLEGRFRAIAAAEDVANGKPDPEVFLCAASRLGCPPENCLVFEDAHVGIAAARAGGMNCIAVTTTHARETFGDTANRIIDSLEEINADDILSMLS